MQLRFQGRRLRQRRMLARTDGIHCDTDTLTRGHAHGGTQQHGHVRAARDPYTTSDTCAPEPRRLYAGPQSALSNEGLAYVGCDTKTLAQALLGKQPARRR